jgi:hypothetical protein
MLRLPPPRRVHLRGARPLMSLKAVLWSVVIALLVYGVVLYARGDFA